MALIDPKFFKRLEKLEKSKWYPLYIIIPFAILYAVTNNQLIGKTGVLILWVYHSYFTVQMLKLNSDLKKENSKYYFTYGGRYSGLKDYKSYKFCQFTTLLSLLFTLAMMYIVLFTSWIFS